MNRTVAAVALIAFSAPAFAASGRYACSAKEHQLVFDFTGKRLTIDGASYALTEGAATWRGKAGGHSIVVAPGENGAKSVFDVSIDSGQVYSGFVVCRRL